MMQVNGNLLEQHAEYVAGAVSAFLPLIAVIAGVFIAFAIVNMLRFVITRMIR